MNGRITQAAALGLSLALCSGPSFAQGGKAAGKTKATWWGHAAWIIETPGGARIAIDPWLANPNAPKDAQRPTQLDAILVTHGHGDHVGNTQELAKATGAKVYVMNELAPLLGLGEAAVGANVGGSFKVKDATIHMVEAVHSSSFGQGENAKYAGSPMGFVIQIDNGPTLYHAGDTAVFSSMEMIGRRFKPTVAMLPIGGHYTMGPEDAARAAALLKPRTIVPMHYGTFPVLTGTPEQLTQALKRERSPAKVRAMKPGETATF